MANGFADPVNYRMSLFNNSPQIISELSGESWLSMVAVHEYVHMLSLSKTGGDVQVLQNLFGNLFLPNALLNGWLSEGIAVYHESMLSPYLGRLNEGYYDAFIGTLVAEGKLPSIVDASFFPARYPNGAMYLYGAQFFDFLANEYGEEKVGELFIEHGSSSFSFLTSLVPGIGIDRSAKQVFNKTLPQLWDEWHVYEQKRFSDYKIEGERLTYHGWNASLTQGLDGKIYYYRSYPLEAGATSYLQKEIVDYDPQTEEINVVIGRSDLANMFTITEDYLYYVTEISVHGYANTSNIGFGTEQILRRLNRQSGAEEVLFRDSMRSFLPLSDGDILYTKDRPGEHGSEIWLYSTVTLEKEFLYSLDYLVHSMLAYEDMIIAVAGEKNHNSNIYQFSLDTAEFTELIGSPFSESQISLCGDKLFFTSNYDNVYRIYSYDLKDGTTSRLTNNGLAVSPIYDSENDFLYYLSLTSEGYDLFRQRTDFPEYRFIPQAFSPLKQIPNSLEEMDIPFSYGEYSDNLNTLSPNIVLPYLEFSDSGLSLGAIMQGMDALSHFSNPSLFEFFKTALVY